VIDHDDGAQAARTGQVLASVREFLGGPTRAGERWAFELGAHLESNWGAAYAGALAASTLALARNAVPECSPRSLHLQMVRPLPTGTAFATAEVRHAGRTVSTIEVDLFDAREKLAVIALVTMVTPSSLAASYHDTRATPPFDVQLAPYPEPPLRPPISHTLQTVREDDGTFYLATSDHARPNIVGTPAFIGRITVPWDDLELTGPEVACLAADPVVGAAMLRSGVPVEAFGPNADLSLRFTTAPAVRATETSGTVLSFQHGTATVAIEVQAGEHQLAHGLSTALLLAPRS
jgi:acyl-coenzyme A thioesterase PaaI-like protein